MSLLKEHLYLYVQYSNWWRIDPNQGWRHM